MLDEFRVASMRFSRSETAWRATNMGVTTATIVVIMDVISLVLGGDHFLELIIVKVSIAIQVKLLNYCGRICVNLHIIKFLCKVSLSDVALVILIEHPESLSRVEQSVTKEYLLVDLSVLIDPQLHLDEVGEFKLFRLVCLLLFIFLFILGLAIFFSGSRSTFPERPFFFFFLVGTLWPVSLRYSSPLTT